MNSRMTSRAMNSGKRFGSMQSSGTLQLVYVMIVDESIGWAKYIARCNEMYPGKIPKSVNQLGDCIYELKDGNNDVIAEMPRPNGSGHDKKDFYQKDVESGRMVLLGTTFWYFGGGGTHSLYLPEKLKNIVPYKQGHRSNSNEKQAPDFVGWFNQMVIEKNLPCGMLGQPKNLNQNVELTTGACKKSHC